MNYTECLQPDIWLTRILVRDLSPFPLKPTGEPVMPNIERLFNLTQYGITRMNFQPVQYSVQPLNRVLSGSLLNDGNKIPYEFT